MEEDMDDFGDIYADVEGYVNAGGSMIPSIRQLYLEDRAKAKSIPGGDDGDSGDEERLLYDWTGRDGRPEAGPAIVAAAAAAAAAASQGSDGKKLPEGLAGGGDDEVAEETNDSDSDDDLRIVLNEEDCKRYVPPQRVGLGNGGLPAGACTNEDADDESMIVTGVEHTSKEQKGADLSPLPVEGLEQSGLERYGSLKNGFATPYSQFKYVRSQSAGCPSNAKSTGQGYVVPFTSPMTLSGDWDVNSLLATTSCHVGFLVPRNRTIFDIRIESFDRKPWRNQGVDITDFFNFGLNEDSWKQYCDNMVLFRKQATWMARNTIYGSIRPTQAFDAESLHGASSAGASLREVAHLEVVGTAASVVAKPKGKAIQVEGGSGERLPSVDIRRPRYHDSDVVIQIPVEVSDKDAAVLPKENPEHIDDFVPHSANGVYGGDKEAVDCDKKEHPESRSTILKDPEEKLQSLPDSNGIVNEEPRKTNGQDLGTSCASADADLHNSCPSSAESISEASEDDLSADTCQSPAKRSSLGSVAGSDISVGSTCDHSHAERVNDGSYSQDPGLYLEEQRSRSEAKLCDIVESDNVHTDSNKEGRSNSDSLRRYHGKLGKRSTCNHHGGEDPSTPSSLKQTKMSKSRESWRFAEKKRLNKSSHTEHSHRSELDPLRGNCHRSHNLHGRRDCRRNDVEQTECKIPKKDESGWGMEFVIQKERYTRSIPDHMPFYTEKDWCVLHRSKTAYDRRWCGKPDAIFEDTCMKQYIEVNDPKQFPYCDRNEASQVDFDRNAPYRALDRRSRLRRRERYDRNLCTDIGDSQGYVEDDEDWSYSNQRFLDVQTFRPSPCIDGRVWHESSPPRIYEHNSRRSNEVYVGHCGISGAREAQFNRQREWDLLDPCTMDNFSSYRDLHEIDSGHCSIEERGGHGQNTLSSERRKSSCISQRRHTIEDQVRHQMPDDSHFLETYASCERVYRHENSCGKPSLKILHSRSLLNENGMRVPRKTGSIAKEQNCVRHREAVGGHLNGYEGKPLEKYDDVVYKRKKIRDDKMEGFNPTDEIWRKGNPGMRQKMEDHNTQVINSTIEKVKQCDSGDYGAHCNEEHDGPTVLEQDDSGLEEGQLVEPEDDDAAANAKKWDSEETVPVSSTAVRHAHDEKKKPVKDTANNKKPIEFDNSRILETLAKMEKRRERFKEPIAPTKVQGNALSTLSQVMVESEVKVERPTRKRRWGAVKDPAA